MAELLDLSSRHHEPAAIARFQQDLTTLSLCTAGASDPLSWPHGHVQPAKRPPMLTPEEATMLDPSVPSTAPTQRKRSHQDKCWHHHCVGPWCLTKASARHAEQQEVVGDKPAHLEVSLGTQAGRPDASATVTACTMPPEGRRGRPRCPAWLHSGWSLAKELPRQLSTVRNESRSLSGRPNFERSKRYAAPPRQRPSPISLAFPLCGQGSVPVLALAIDLGPTDLEMRTRRCSRESHRIEACGTTIRTQQAARAGSPASHTP